MSTEYKEIFGVSAGWKAAFPGAHVGWLALEGVTNPPQHAALEAQKEALQAALRAQFSGKERQDLAQLPALLAYNAYYKNFKKTYHVQGQLESILYKGKSIPSVAALVEAMFMAEIKNQLLTAGHDLDALELPLRLDVADGSETYTLMRGEAQALKAGDMYIADSAGIISSIIYGPDQRTQIRPATRRVIFTVYAPQGIPAAAVTGHLEDLRDNVLLVAPQAQALCMQVSGS